MALFFELLDDHAVVSRYLPEDGYDVVHIPNQAEGLPITGIGPGAFRHCDQLRAVILPMTLEEIGSEAFACCEKLTCVGVAESEDHSVFPPSLTYVGKQAFRRTGLKELSFASPQLELDSGCFQNSAVTSAFFVGADITLRDSVFAETPITLVAMPEAEIHYLGKRCFAFCKALQTFTAKKINAVGDGCFHGCSILQQLPVRKPMLQVGNGAFYDCTELHTEGYFRTMYDLICAWGIEHMVYDVAKRKCPFSLRQTQHYLREEHETMIAARHLIDKIKSTPHRDSSALLLLGVIGADYYGMGDGWDYSDQFFLFVKEDIRKRFRDVWPWQVTQTFSLSCPSPCERYIDDLTEEEVLRMLQYELSPKPYPIDWDDLDTLLNAELGGSSIRYFYSAVADFLSCLLDHALGREPHAYIDIPTAQLEEKYFGEEADWLTDEEKLHSLRWNILLNRIAIHRELKYAHDQLTSLEAMYHG